MFFAGKSGEEAVTSVTIQDPNEFILGTTQNLQVPPYLRTAEEMCNWFPPWLQ